MRPRVLLALSAVPLFAATGTDMPSFEGTWTGGAEIVVSWTVQRTLNVTLAVDSSRNVGGCVGDAALVGRIARNRGALLRALSWKTDYIIDARLTGPIIAAEGIVRDGIRIPFNLVDRRIEGGLHTTGAKFGGKDYGILSARRLVLRRVAAVSDAPRHPPVCASEGR
jgi:hypothetical protein